MNEPKKRICKMDILAPLNASKETTVALAARSAIVLSTMNTTVKKGRHQKRVIHNVARSVVKGTA
jgi:hypothetical protein